MKSIDLSNRTFGRLTAIQRVPSGKRNQTVWLCRCECGIIKLVQTGVLLNGDTKSCGCLMREVSREMAIQMNTTHGWSGTPTYETWKAMIQRCTNRKNPNYDDYGGRGICVCKRWRKFEGFLADMGKRPSENHTIGRIDNKKGYEHGNCRWETPVEQANNRRTNLMVRLGDETKTLMQWCKEMGLEYQTIHGRIVDRKWHPKRALSEPIKRKVK